MQDQDKNKQLTPQKIEKEVLELWEYNKVFQNLQKRKVTKNNNFVFFEGPPTANGYPGVHHVIGRTFKDVILRHKSMQGKSIIRNAGWDTQGLPVEIEAEKTLDLKSKKAIEEYGVAKFNKVAKSSVFKYKDEWESITKNIAFWLDFDNAYITYKNNYLESLWWIFSQIEKKGLLKKSYKIVPFCARCGTPLSSHELAQPGAYKKVQDPSAFVLFPLNSHSTQKEFILIWTTTPWTLPANSAVALSKKIKYKKWQVNFQGEEVIIYSSNKLPNTKEDEVRLLDEVDSSYFTSLTYIPPYENSGLHTIHEADFVEEGDGTGFVHIAPAYGEEDFNLMKDKMGENSIPKSINEEGNILEGFPGEGKFVKEADKDIFQDLKNRHLLFYRATIDHEYPHCWRCSSPLLYLARNSWFVEVSRIRKNLVKENKKINWYPSHIKEGRFGNWIKEVKDWAISRDRFWGTPLPIWECTSCDERLVVSSLKDLDIHSFQNNEFFTLRHLESTHNKEDILSSGGANSSLDNSSSLTEKGVKLGEKLSKDIQKLGITRIIVSPYKRTRQTAEVISRFLNKKVDIIIDERLKEIEGGYFSGKSEKEWQAYFEGEKEWFEKVPPQGESRAEVQKRVIDCLNFYNSKFQNEKILFISHGDPLYLFELAVKGIELKNKNSIKPQKTGELRKFGVINRPFDEDGNLDMHKPFIDDIKLKCSKCNSKMQRVKEVADIWFDSGCMPYASWHYPFENKKMIDNDLQFPADYISEAMDQTRGWFYTLLVIGTILGKGAPMKNIVCYGLILDKNGQKMSKSKGNVVRPQEMIERYGADALRFYLLSINAPGEAKKFDDNDLSRLMSRTTMTLLNCLTFYTTYAKEDVKNFKEDSLINPLDIWMVNKLRDSQKEISKLLDDYSIFEATAIVENIIDDLSRWYIRRSRRRLQQNSDQKDFEIASSVLKYSLKQVSLIIAPFMPFVSDYIWTKVKDKKDKDSVHLSVIDTDNLFVDKNILKNMSFIRELTTKVLSLRSEFRIKVRQPLSSVTLNSKYKLPKKYQKDLFDILKDEVNVKDIFISDEVEDVVLDTNITKELFEEGFIREVIRFIQGLRQENNLIPKDKIILSLNSSEEVKNILQKDILAFKNIGVEKIEWGFISKVDKSTIKVDTYEFEIAIRKIN